MSGRLTREYFDRIYATEDDPWGFESAWYERRKQALTMALLPRERYRAAFEPGCASGELTRLLSGRADRVLALEMTPRIAERARQRLASLVNVEVRTGAIPEDWPDGRFDLILLSEVAYYLDRNGLDEVCRLVECSLEPGGHVVAVHYLGATDYPLTGSEAQHLLEAGLPCRTIARYSQAEFAALVLERC